MFYKKLCFLHFQERICIFFRICKSQITLTLVYLRVSSLSIKVVFVFVFVFLLLLLLLLLFLFCFFVLFFPGSTKTLHSATKWLTADNCGIILCAHFSEEKKKQTNNSVGIGNRLSNLGEWLPPSDISFYS